MQVFPGNTDRYTVVYNKIDPPIMARYLRLLPEAYQSRIAMRLEFYGCKSGEKCLTLINHALCYQQKRVERKAE